MEAEGHNKGEAHGRKVKDPLGDDEADGEEKVGGRNEGEDEPSNGHHQLPAQGIAFEENFNLGGQRLPRERIPCFEGCKYEMKDCSDCEQGEQVARV